jgi:hypothetical protein
MARKTLLVVACCCLAAGLLAAVETVTKVFTLQHLSVSDASSAVQPLLSEEGSLTIQPRHSRLMVQDLPTVVDRVAELIDEIDRAPGMFRVRVELVRGTSEPYSSGEPTVQIDPRLERMFKFASFRRLAGTTLEGEVGSTAEATLGDDYQVSFQSHAIEYSSDTPWGAPEPGDRINLRRLILKQVGVDANGVRTTAVLLQTNMMLSSNQKVYIGAGSSEESDDGLVLIVHCLQSGVR